MYIIYRDIEGSSFNHPAEAIMGMFMMSLGEFGDFYDSFDETKHQILAIVCFSTLMLLLPHPCMLMLFMFICLFFVL